MKQIRCRYKLGDFVESPKKLMGEFMHEVYFFFYRRQKIHSETIESICVEARWYNGGFVAAE